MGKLRPSAYLDTTVLSALHYRGGNVLALARQIRTRDWWEQERRFFRLFLSVRTEAELAQGEYQWQRASLAEARRLVFLPETRLVRACANAYLEAEIVPASKFGDAVQLAFAVAHRMDYLLTWNHAHLANVDVQRRLDALNRRNGYRSPLLVSPDTIPWAILGQALRRRDDDEDN